MASDLCKFLEENRKQIAHAEALEGVAYVACDVCLGRGTVGEGWTDHHPYGEDYHSPPACGSCRGAGKFKVAAKKRVERAAILREIKALQKRLKGLSKCTK